MDGEKVLLQNWVDWKPTTRAEQVLLSGLLQRTEIEHKVS